MKKYKATKNHPFIEVGKEFKYCESRHRIIFINPYYELPTPPVNIQDWETAKYIKEIQKPEFTRNQLKEFVEGYTNRPLYTSLDQYFDSWLEKQIDERRY